MKNCNRGDFSPMLRFAALFPLLLLLHGCIQSDEPVIMEKEKSGASNNFVDEIPDISGDYVMIGPDGKEKGLRTIIRDATSANAFFAGEPDMFFVGESGMQIKPVPGGRVNKHPLRLLVAKLPGHNRLLLQHQNSVVQGSNEKVIAHVLTPVELVPEGLRYYNALAAPDSKHRTWNVELWADILARHGLTADKGDIRKLVRGQSSANDYAAKVTAAIHEMLEANALTYTGMLMKTSPGPAGEAPVKNAGSAAPEKKPAPTAPSATTTTTIISPSRTGDRPSGCRPCPSIR